MLTTFCLSLPVVSISSVNCAIILCLLLTVFHALIICKARLDAVLRKALDDRSDRLDNRSDRLLFDSLQSPEHCLNHLLPSISPATSRYHLRSRGHAFTLPTATGSYKKSFIVRSLYKYKQQSFVIIIVIVIIIIIINPLLIHISF